MNHLIARELINNGLLALDVALVLFIVRHLAGDIRYFGWRKAYDRLGNQAALALMVLMIGHVLIRGWGAALIWHYQQGSNALLIENRYPVAMLGAGVALVGMVCCIRIFSRAHWGHWGWLGSLVAATLFVGGMRLL